MPFYNIFSKAKEKQLESQKKARIIIDNREKNSLVASELVRLGFQIEFQQLPVADYLINNIAIERKTINDLKSSIISKRIFTQMQEIKQYLSHLLVIEGEKDELFNNKVLSSNALRGFLLSVSLQYKIPIIFTKNERDTAFYLAILAKKKEDREISIRAKKLSLDKKEQVQYILEGFPNVGPVRARKLIDRFKSIKNIINADKRELEEILEKRAKEFKKLLE
jgi:Fanconi anemia group M protein